jgi:hypothetical protein
MVNPARTMKTFRFSFAGRALVAASIAAVAAIAPVAHAAACMTPMMMAPEFAPGEENTVSWIADVSGGFEVQVSLDQMFGTVLNTVTKGPGAEDHTFEGLGEAEYFYRARAKAGSGCTMSAWSAPVSTIQDSTAPQVTITTRPEPIAGLVPTPVPTYVMEDDIRLAGTAADLPGGTAPAGVGAAAVVLGLENTTPLLGGSEPAPQTAQVNMDGTWQVRFCTNTVACPGGKPASGTYTVNVVGVDFFGNTGDQPATLAIIIVL